MDKEMFDKIQWIKRKMVDGGGFFFLVEDCESAGNGGEHFSLRTLTNQEDETAMVAFTNEDEMRKSGEFMNGAQVRQGTIVSYLELLVDTQEVVGLLINPYGENLFLTKEYAQVILATKPRTEDSYIRDNQQLNRAIQFATERHAGQLRKGTQLPYIIHPMETMTILTSMQADTNLLMAGVLHDVLEDTDTTEIEIVERFGLDVAGLVVAHTHSKEGTWDERKSAAIARVEQADQRVKMLVLADKVANLRSMRADYKVVGEELWKRFHAPKEKQAWYYSKMQDALYEMQTLLETEDVYWEMVDLYKDLFS